MSLIVLLICLSSHVTIRMENGETKTFVVPSHQRAILFSKNQRSLIVDYDGERFRVNNQFSLHLGAGNYNLTQRSFANYDLNYWMMDTSQCGGEIIVVHTNTEMNADIKNVPANGLCIIPLDSTSVTVRIDTPFHNNKTVVHLHNSKSIETTSVRSEEAYYVETSDELLQLFMKKTKTSLFQSDCIVEKTNTLYQTHSASTRFMYNVKCKTPDFQWASTIVACLFCIILSFFFFYTIMTIITTSCSNQTMSQTPKSTTSDTISPVQMSPDATPQVTNPLSNSPLFYSPSASRVTYPKTEFPTPGIQ